LVRWFAGCSVFRVTRLVAELCAICRFAVRTGVRSVIRSVHRQRDGCVLFATNAPNSDHYSLLNMWLVWCVGWRSTKRCRTALLLPAHSRWYTASPTRRNSVFAYLLARTTISKSPESRYLLQPEQTTTTNGNQQPNY
jgi:hypothetical protein